MHYAVARGLALFLGVFTLLNLAGNTAFDANLWWIGLPMPLLLAALAIALLWPRTMRAAAAILCAVAVVNAIGYYVVLARGAVRSSVPVPLSLLIAIALLFIAASPRDVGRGSAPAGPGRRPPYVLSRRWRSSPRRSSFRWRRSASSARPTTAARPT
jgi:hypothetical protein